MIKSSDARDSLFIDIAFTIPLTITTVVLNLVNVGLLGRLTYLYFKQQWEVRRRRREEENVFNSVFRNREGYTEARQELEAAGIQSSELDEIQRMELRNARRLLNQFGSRALQNINMLRLILNIDGDRDPEDTEEQRVILFTKIASLPYNQEKHSHAESCPICCVDFDEDQYIKILPKCNHIFHEDCIEKWILKAKNRYIC
jgi:hypothetical protein